MTATLHQASYCGASLGECGGSIGAERPGRSLLTRCLTTCPIQAGAIG